MSINAMMFHLNLQTETIALRCMTCLIHLNGMLALKPNVNYLAFDILADTSSKCAISLLDAVVNIVMVYNRQLLSRLFGWKIRNSTIFLPLHSQMYCPFHPFFKRWKERGDAFFPQYGKLLKSIIDFWWLLNKVLFVF